MSLATTLRRPAAFVPLVMSLAAFAVVIVAVTVFGAGPEPDEGTAAHVFQLLLAAQLPVVVYFAATTLPYEPRAALIVLTAQALAGVVALVPVFAFGL